MGADVCSATGWTDWNELSTCSIPCGGSRSRFQICQGEDCTANSQSEKEAADCTPDRLSEVMSRNENE